LSLVSSQERHFWLEERVRRNTAKVGHPTFAGFFSAFALEKPFLRPDGVGVEAFIRSDLAYVKTRVFRSYKCVKRI